MHIYFLWYENKLITMIQHNREQHSVLINNMIDRVSGQLSNHLRIVEGDVLGSFISVWCH